MEIFGKSITYSLTNTDGSRLGEDYTLQLPRIGRGLHGVSFYNNFFGTKPAFRIKGNITQLKRIKQNEEVNQSQTINIYPNPSNGTLAVVSNASAILNNITNIMGETVIALNGNESNINIESLNAGIYFLNFQVNGENQTIRIIRD